MNNIDSISPNTVWYYTARFKKPRDSGIYHEEFRENVIFSNQLDAHYIEDFLKNSQSKYKAIKLSIDGAWIGGLTLLPFGPATLLLGVSIGCFCGFIIGLATDFLNYKFKRDHAKAEKKRIRQLMRWANFQFSICEEQIGVLLRVALEYKVLVTMGEFSKTARRQIILLYKFLNRQDVQLVLNNYFNFVLTHPHQMKVQDWMLFATLFNVYMNCYVHMNKPLPESIESVYRLVYQTPWLAEKLTEYSSLHHYNKKEVIENLSCLLYMGDLSSGLLPNFMKAVSKSYISLPRIDSEKQQQQSEADDISSCSDTQDIEVEQESLEENKEDLPRQFNETSRSYSLDVESLKPEISSLRKNLPQHWNFSLKHKSEISRIATFTNETTRRSSHKMPFFKLQKELTEPALNRKPALLGRSTPRIFSGFTGWHLGPDIYTSTYQKFPQLDPATEQHRRDHTGSSEDDSNIMCQKTNLDLSTRTGRRSNVKEKKLFRSLTDLQYFDTVLKCETPIGAYELSFLMRLESTNDETEWECTVQNPKCSVYKKKGDSPIVLVKAFVTLEDIPASVLTFFIQHIPTRKKWDKAFEDYQLVEKNVEGNELIYCSMRAPWPVANRDFLQWRRIETLDDGTVVIMMRSASHRDFPEKPGVVRAETIISGYIIRSIQTKTSLFIAAQTDIRGLVPKIIVNRVAQKAPLQWSKDLETACTRYIKIHGTSLPDYENVEPASF